MSFETEAAEALRIAGDFSVQDFYPAPFPSDVPIAGLEKISLSRLLNGDNVESERLFKTCTTSGFFYLDMLDHALGRQLWRSACRLHQLSRDRFASTPAEEKCRFKPLPGVRVFDRGYLVRNEPGKPAEMELINVPQSEFFGTKLEGGALPEWLTSDDRDVFKETIECGNTVARAVLSVLEKNLELPPGSISKLHRLYDESSDFARVIRYAGAPIEEKPTLEGFVPHRDAMSTAILFTWLGGLQIPRPNAEIEGFVVKPDDWTWVRPEPGYATVNLGDAMAIFSNNLFKSSIHRVVKAPGDQRPHDRFSVVIATRPKNDAIMKPFESAVVPPYEEKEKPVTSLEWGHNIVSNIQKRAIARGATSLSNA